MWSTSVSSPWRDQQSWGSQRWPITRKKRRSYQYQPHNRSNSIPSKMLCRQPLQFLTLKQSKASTAATDPLKIPSAFFSLWHWSIPLCSLLQLHIWQPFPTSHHKPPPLFAQQSWQWTLQPEEGEGYSFHCAYSWSQSLLPAPVPTTIFFVTGSCYYADTYSWCPQLNLYPILAWDYHCLAWFLDTGFEVSTEDHNSPSSLCGSPTMFAHGHTVVDAKSDNDLGRVNS